MKTSVSRLAAAFAILFMAFAITGCGPQEDPEVAVSGVSLSQSSLTMEEGGTANLTATVSPSNATNKTVIWSSSNNYVAKVSEGTVTAIAEGTATITAVVCGKTASCTVTINKKEIAVSSVTLDKTDAELEKGSTLTIRATVNPDDATDKTVTWSSSDDKVATVKNGTVTAVADGTATVTAKVGDKSASCTVKVNDHEKEIREILMKLYDALDGPNWKTKDGWGTDRTLSSWAGVSYRKDNFEVSLSLHDVGLKGEIPASIGDLGVYLVSLGIFKEPGLTGTLPDSFRKLTNLRYLAIQETSMTSLPDVFSDMTSLNEIYINYNEKMTGPIPESLDSSPVLEKMFLGANYFTGGVKASWARLGKGVAAERNCLSGNIPQAFLDSEYSRHFFDTIFFAQRDGYYFDITDVDIPGFTCWPEGEVEDLDGNVFSFPDVVKKNRYTVYLNWGPWCPFSKALLPQLKDYYEKYRQDGLEIIATVMLDENGDFWNDLAGQKQEVTKKGYDQWYNFYYWSEHRKSYLLYTPAAEVYDSDGYLLFSSFGSEAPDPVRKRYGKTASTDLIPFLETLLGPSEVPDAYASTDYSKDGEVMTLQKASVGKGINIVFMGDGYTDKDMGKGGLYETVMNQAMEEFFAIEPYKSFRDRFNVYAVKVVSKNGRIGEGYETALGTAFGNATYVGGNDEKVYEYAFKAPGVSDRSDLLVSVLVNTKRQAGTTVMSASTQSSVAYSSSMGNDPVYFGPTLRHEAGGHGFGFLDDEYVVSQSAVPQSFIDDRKDKYTKYGWFANVDFTDDPAKVKWSAFLNDERYNSQIGIIEGAYYATGAWRPSENSMMKENMEYFNAPSRWAIYQRIMKLSGEECSFDKFLTYDAINRGKQQQSAVRPPLKMPEGRKPGAPPVIVP